MSEEQSPLSEANPIISMQEIMSRDPEDLSRADRDAIVRVLRAARFEFAKQEALPKAAKPKLKKLSGPVSLKDLGL